MNRPRYTEWDRAPMWAQWVGWNADGSHEFSMFNPRPWKEWDHVEQRTK